jgi:predicted RNase H-like HicB family nuclease
VLLLCFHFVVQNDLVIIYLSGSIVEQQVQFIMKTFTFVIERCPETNLFVGYVPGFPGAHSQGKTVEELQSNLSEVISMLLEDGEPILEAEFIGTQNVQVA